MVCTMAGDLADLFGSTGMDTKSPHRGGDKDDSGVYSPLASTWADPKRAGGWASRHSVPIAIHILYEPTYRLYEPTYIAYM